MYASLPVLLCTSLPKLSFTSKATPRPSFAHPHTTSGSRRLYRTHRPRRLHPLRSFVHAERSCSLELAVLGPRIASQSPVSPAPVRSCWLLQHGAAGAALGAAQHYRQHAEKLERHPPSTFTLQQLQPYLNGSEKARRTQRIQRISAGRERLDRIRSLSMIGSGTGRSWPLAVICREIFTDEDDNKHHQDEAEKDNFSCHREARIGGVQP